MLQDGETVPIADGRGQRIALSWHPGAAAPGGQAHGSAGICVTEAGIVLVSADGNRWDFPAGRPEGAESWEHTLRREMLEEACALVTDARLLGFARGQCMAGPERGLVLVRSVWLAQVRLLAWEPRFETRFRRVVPVVEAIGQVAETFRPIWRRAFAEGGLV